MNERSIFVEALERSDPSEQAAYLDTACEGDAAMRERVERLLASYGNAKTFLEIPPDVLIATIAGSDFESTNEISLHFLEPSSKPGCLGTLAQYEVVEVVGRGGMGIVLRAYDNKLNRVVAIKAIAPEMAANATAVKRFLREAQAAAAVSHDHVVTIFAIHDESRVPYIVMEFIEGPSLQEKIERTGGLELKEVLRIGMQAAAGLAAAHEQGLVHRDIKPSNILLENGVERVKITDFGLARAVDDVSITQPGLISGTPQYMSPEQARGQAFDHRSDLFSLGSVLYMMCAGRTPFQADTSLAMLRAVLEDSPRSLRDINPEIPVWLEAIIARLLAKDPDHRFQSAREVSELLGQWLAHVQNPLTKTPPVRSRFGDVAPDTFARETASFATRVSFQFLMTLHVLCIAGFAMLCAIEVESILVAGFVCGILGLAVTIVGRKQSPRLLGLAVGLSAVPFGLLVTAIIVLFNMGPSNAQSPISWLVFAYEMFAIPAGLAVLLPPPAGKPAKGRFGHLRFGVQTLLGLMFVAAAAFAAMRLVVSLSYVWESRSPIALTTGVFVATALVLAWMMRRCIRQNRLAEPDGSKDLPVRLLFRRGGWMMGILIVGALCFVGASGLLLWEFERTNFGYVIFRSPVNDILIERLRDGRVERTYDTLHGGGTAWHVPLGRWEFRIKGDRADYRLDQTKLHIQRGAAIRVNVVPTQAATPPRDTTSWDKLVAVAEKAYLNVFEKAKAGLESQAALHQSHGGLIEAKIQRARATSQRDEVISLLKELISVREQQLASVEALYRAGKTTQLELQTVIKSLVEAQADLEEAGAER